MSFAFDVKKELCSNIPADLNRQKAQLYGMMLFSKKFSSGEISLKSENRYVIDAFENLLTLTYMPIIEKTLKLRAKNNNPEIYTASIPDSEECKKIYEDMGHNENFLSLRVNRANIEDDICAASFLKGVFLACGSVTDPNKNYHLEFVVPYKNLCNDLCSIIDEIQECSVSPKILNRNGTFIAYIKDSEQITDLLTYMGACNGAMTIMGAKALKQIRTNVNRRANSEFSNIQKSAQASVLHIKAINKLKEKNRFDFLPPELLETAQLRLEFPELSLRGLGEKSEPKISRSAVNRRLTKIMEIADKL